eukprot:1154070-Pelagomonas_calceolata.AAC.1
MSLYPMEATSSMLFQLPKLPNICLEVLSGVEDEDDAGVLACSLQLPILELAAMLLSSSQSSHTHNGCVPQQEQQQQQQTEKAKFKSKQQSKAKGFGSFKPSPHPAQLQDTFQGLSLLTINARRLELMAQWKGNQNRQCWTASSLNEGEEDTSSVHEQAANQCCVKKKREENLGG